MPRNPIIAIAALFGATALFALSSTATAADGVCVSSYSKFMPGVAGQGYVTVWKGMTKRSVPLSYREGFSEATRRQSVEIPSGEDAFEYIVHFNKEVTVSGPPPHSKGTTTKSLWQTDYGTVRGKGEPSWSLPWLPDEVMAGLDRFAINHPLDPNIYEWQIAENLGFSPDIDAPDGAVLDAAVRNAGRLTAATLLRLQTFASLGQVDQPYLDFKAPVQAKASGLWTTNTDWEVVAWDPVAVECAFFIEMIKHPRLQDVYMLKSFIQTSRKTGLADVHPVSSWLVAYAPVSLDLELPAPPANVAPALNADLVTTGHTVPITFNVLANDTDPDNGPEPLKLISVQQPEHGFLSMNPNGDGTVTFIPEKGFIGTVAVPYTATDGEISVTSSIVLTTIQCFDEEWQDAKLQCDFNVSPGSADFASTCTFDPAGSKEFEIDCPVNE